MAAGAENVAGPSSRYSHDAPARSVGSSAHMKIGSVYEVPTARRLLLPARMIRWAAPPEAWKAITPWDVRPCRYPSVQFTLRHMS